MQPPRISLILHNEAQADAWQIPAGSLLGSWLVCDWKEISRYDIVNMGQTCYTQKHHVWKAVAVVYLPPGSVIVEAEVTYCTCNLLETDWQLKVPLRRGNSRWLQLYDTNHNNKHVFNPNPLPN